MASLKPARVGLVLLGIAGVVLTPLVCAGTVLVAMIGPSSPYMDPRSAEEWIRRIAEASASLIWCSGVLTAGLLLAIAFAVAAARLQEASAMWLGTVAATMLVASLLLVIGFGPGQVDAVSARAIAAIGDVPAAVQPPPGPVASAPPSPTTDDARASLRDLVGASLNAAGSVADPDGKTLAASDVVFVSAACGDAGARLSAELAFTTGEADGNAAALARILRAWDEAGFAPDRALQLDIRYSETAVVERMTIKDSSTIDGLIHMTVTTRCALPG